MELTKEQIDSLAGYNNQKLEHYVANSRRRLMNAGVVMNSMELMDKIEIVEAELERRKGESHG